MRDEGKAGLRCRPGDLARVVRASNQRFLGQIVLVEQWRPEFERWQVCFMNGPQYGRGLRSGSLMFDSRCGFRDSSLEPLTRPKESAECHLDQQSASHHRPLARPAFFPEST